MILTYEFETILWLFFFFMTDSKESVHRSHLFVNWTLRLTLVCLLNAGNPCLRSWHLTKMHPKSSGLLPVTKWFNWFFFLHFWQFYSLFGDLFLAWRCTVLCVCLALWRYCNTCDFITPSHWEEVSLNPCPVSILIGCTLHFLHHSQIAFQRLPCWPW